MKKLLLLLVAFFPCAGTLLAQVESDSAALRARHAAQEAFTDLNGEGWTIRTDTTHSVPVSIFVSVPIEQVLDDLSSVRPQGKTPAEKAVRFFTAHKEMFGLQPTQDEMVVEQTRQSEGRSYVSLNQVYRGVPVYRGNYTVTLDETGALNMVSGEFFPGIDRLLLDTHTLIWWHEDNARLSRPAFGAIRDLDNEVFLSVVNA